VSNQETKTVLVLRTCRDDMTSTNNFKWPQVGEVATAPDWKQEAECGNGLHGWLYGQGDHSCSSFLDASAKWLVVEVEESTIVMLGGKCKFPSATVRFVGSKKDATDFLIANEPRAASVAVIGATVAVGDSQSATVGALGTATAGYKGTATAGNYGTATAGNYGTATAGYKGTATAGYKGTATAGNYGTATAGYKGTATAGNYGTATAGDEGEIRIRYWDTKANRYRTKVGYIGEDGLEPNIAYRLDDQHKFVSVAEEAKAA
jgi:hypothetical protein